MDDIHYSFRKIDGYNKPINIIISPREPGKTSMFWMTKVYNPWKKTKKPWLYLVRNANEITEALVDSIQDVFNKFTDDNVKLEYSRSSLESGILDVRIKGELIFRILALNIKLRKIKLSLIKNIAGIGMDEYIIDPNSNEKYLKGEEMKIKEIYTTYRREADGILKMYFLGNPYSLYNPLFVWLKVDTHKLRPGAIVVGDQYVVECYQLTEELKKYILEHNPLYEFDDSYKAYAFDGMAVNDKNIKLGSFPPHYNLRFIFRINNMNIGVFQNNYFEDGEDRYYCKEVTGFSPDRNIFCFQFEDLIHQSILVSLEERRKIQNFKTAFRKRQVTFSNVNVYYMIEEVYFNL